MSQIYVSSMDYCNQIVFGFFHLGNDLTHDDVREYVMQHYNFSPMGTSIVHGHDELANTGYFIAERFS